MRSTNFSSARRAERGKGRFAETATRVVLGIGDAAGVWGSDTDGSASPATIISSHRENLDRYIDHR